MAIHYDLLSDSNKELYTKNENVEIMHFEKYRKLLKIKSEFLVGFIQLSFCFEI